MIMAKVGKIIIVNKLTSYQSIKFIRQQEKKEE
jgi:hypothetical protein